nr:hypothetical protein Q903MT_gene2199 [Picea sitchensis]
MSEYLGHRRTYTQRQRLTKRKSFGSYFISYLYGWISQFAKGLPYLFYIRYDQL